MPQECHPCTFRRAFFGFLGGCIIFNTGDIGWTTIYGTQTNLSAFAFTHQLAYRLGQVDAPAGKAWLAAADLPTAGIERQVALRSEIRIPEEL